MLKLLGYTERSEERSLGVRIDGGLGGEDLLTAIEAVAAPGLEQMRQMRPGIGEAAFSAPGLQGKP